MSVEKLIKTLEEQYSAPSQNYPLCDTTYATSIDNVKKLLAIVKVQRAALKKLEPTSGIATSALIIADKIAREGV